MSVHCQIDKIKQKESNPHWILQANDSEVHSYSEVQQIQTIYFSMHKKWQNGHEELVKISKHFASTYIHFN